ncbi:MAG: hypothetical protein IJ128_05895 [Firmicutes bacterium]|nr:hypothetical protein [Bacillota bacterium]
MKAARILKHTSLVLVLIGLIAVLAGCGSGNFGVRVNEDLNIEITAEDAAVDSAGSAGTFTVGEGQSAVIEPSLDQGTILIQIIPFEGASDADLNVEEAAAGADPAMEAEVTGTDPLPCELAAGDYMVTATVTEKANGTVLIRTEGSDSSQAGGSLLEADNLNQLMQQVADSEISKSYEEYLPDQAFANAEVFSDENGKAYVYLNTEEFVILNDTAYEMSGGAGEAIIDYTISDDGIKLDTVEWSADGEDHDKWVEDNFSKEALKEWKSYEPYDENGYLKLNTKMIAKAEEELGVPVERENLLEIDTEKGTYEIVKTKESGSPENDDYSFDTETVEKGILEEK